MGGFLSLDNALSGTLANRRAIDVISHNIANASDEDYSRQTAELTSNKPLKIGGISVGTGVQVSGVNRARDQLIDFRFRQENTNLGKFEQLNTVFKQIEAAVNEPSDGSIRAVFQKFNESMQALSNAPENRGARRSMIGQAKTFIGVLKRMNKQFQQIAGEGGGTGQNSADAKLETLVKEINNIGKQIASLNLEINATKAAGGNPNDLLDKRTALVNDLSKKIDTNVGQDDGKFRVNVGGYTLAQGGESHTFSYEQLPGDDGKRIHYDDELRSKVVPEGGRTAALIELRDEVIPKLVKDLNDFAVQYVDRFNDIHKAGFGLDGQTRNNFFSELPTSDSGVYRFEGMGSTGGSIQDQRSGYINSPETVLTGDPSTSKPENFETDEGVLSQNAGGNNIGSPEGKLNINGNVINYDMSEDTINDIINRINDSENKATAYLSAENRLVIKGVQENDYQIDELNDTGLLMDKLNILTVGGSDRTVGRRRRRARLLEDGLEPGRTIRRIRHKIWSEVEGGLVGIPELMGL
ncbi:MAG: flagellar hook-associated protein FlgK [bacterium]